MRAIRLIHGTGDGKSKACLITATSMVCGTPELLDRNPAVCEMLRYFGVFTNDIIPEDILSDVYGFLIWELPGTATVDKDVRMKRGLAFIDWAIRFGFSEYLRALEFNAESKKFEAFPEINNCDQLYGARAFLSMQKELLPQVTAYPKHLKSEYIDSFRIGERTNLCSVLSNIMMCLQEAEVSTNPLKLAAAAGTAAAAATGTHVKMGTDPEPFIRTFPDLIVKIMAIGDERPKERDLKDRDWLANQLSSEQPVTA